MAFGALTNFLNLIRKVGAIGDLPAFSATDYPAGHEFRNDATGDLYRNIGTREYGLHVCPGINRFELDELFLLKPGINADRDVPAANTYNTAQMQLGIDRNAHWEVLGTNAVSADCAFADGGGLTISSHGAATDSTILTPHLNSAVSAFAAAKWNTEDEITFETTIVTDTLIADETIWAGFKLTNTPVTATDNDQVMFRFKDDASSGVWQCIDSNNNTDNVQASTVTVAASTVYNLKIVVDGSRIPRYFINGAFAKKGSALKADTDLIPYLGILSDTSATVKALKVRRIRVGKTYND